MTKLSYPLAGGVPKRDEPTPGYGSLRHGPSAIGLARSVDAAGQRAPGRANAIDAVHTIRIGSIKGVVPAGDLRCWGHAATMTGITAEAILAHPRFGQARQAHLDALVALFRDDPVARSLMADAGLIILRGVLVGAHLALDVGDRATWPTPGNLKRVLVERGLASPRRVDDLLARFRQAGWMTIVLAPGDRRVRLLVPTPPVLAHDRAHLAAYHRFLLVLFPGRGYEWVLGQDEGAHRALRAATWRDLPRGTSALDHAAIRLFLARDAGYLALLLVAQAQLSGRPGPTWTELAETLGVARSHLRTLFGEAEAAGYVHLHARGTSPVRILSPLWDAYDGFLAAVQADQDTLAQRVFAQCNRGSQRELSQ